MLLAAKSPHTLAFNQTLQALFIGLSATLLYGLLRISQPPKSKAHSQSLSAALRSAQEETPLSGSGPQTIFFSYLAQGTNDILLVTDSEGRIVEANDRACQAYDYDREELLKCTLNDLRTLPSPADQLDEWEQAAQPGGSFFETLHRRKDSSLFPVEVSSRVLDIDGTAFCQSIIRDISKRKRIEENLKKSLHFTQQLLEKLPNPIWHCDAEGQHDYFNQAWLHFTGRTMEQELGYGWTEGIHPEDAKRFLLSYREAFALRQPFLMEYRLRHCSGEYRRVSAHGQPFYDLEGHFSGYLGACIDINEQTLREEQLQQLTAQVEKQARTLDTILSVTPDIVMMWDQEGRCLYSNTSASTILGLDQEQLLGRDWRKCPILPPEVGISFGEDLRSVFATATPVKREITLPLAEGEKDFEYVLTAVPGADHSVEAVVSTVRDITERNRAAQKIIQLKEELERKVAIRTEELSHANARLELWAQELQQRHREMIHLGEMTDLIQSCDSAEEAYPIIERFAALLFPGQSGKLFILDETGSLLECTASWGTQRDTAEELIFTRDRCWALRRSEIHFVSDNRAQPRCDHVREQIPYICLPLLAHGDALGLLHVVVKEEITQSEVSLENQQRLAQLFRDRLALTLSNLKLRQNLRHLSLQDPVTGLYNRRFLEEAIKLQILRAKRAHAPLAVAMMDIDHFKQINDLHGHDAGDAALRAVADLLQKSIRQGDVVCRFGGEEFVLLLPDTSLEVANRRSEALRLALEKLALQHSGKALTPLTVSLGVAAYPDHGLTSQALIKAADAALYRAKAAGRNQICVAEVVDCPQDIP
jgi:diguanylate cyclase (GGDEF)-like protein/PAS domain S-box-containing protein